ncbi:hypothetical protein HPB47_014636, partial [Ixodes persulcatus]
MSVARLPHSDVDDGLTPVWPTNSQRGSTKKDSMVVSRRLLTPSKQGGTRAAIPEPLRGSTLQDRHHTKPAALYRTEKLRLLCLLCGVPEICRAAHERGKLRGERRDADRITHINQLGLRDFEEVTAF